MRTVNKGFYSLLIAILFCFSFLGRISAQNDSSAIGFNIKINPFEWLYDDIRVFVEYPLNKNNSFQLRLGYRDSHINPYEIKYLNTERRYYNSSAMQYDTAKYSSRGFMLGLAFNHYFRNKWYIQPSFLFKHYHFIFSPDENMDNLLVQLTTYDETEAENRNNFVKNIYALEFRYGKVFVFNRFLLDTYVGAGARLRWQQIDDVNPYGTQYDTQSSGSINYEFVPTLHLGLNIGWKIGK